MNRENSSVLGAMFLKGSFGSLYFGGIKIYVMDYAIWLGI
jgi:hypothetical protein